MTTGFASQTNQQRDIQPVAIISIDPVTRIAKAMTGIRTEIEVDCRFPVGGMYVIPAVGDQWYVDRYDMVWHLHSRLPFNDNNILVEPTPGQMVIGGTGPVELNGSHVNVHGDTNIDGILALGDTLIRGGPAGVEFSGPAPLIEGSLVQSLDGGETWNPLGGPGASEIGDITGLQEALDSKVDKRDPITEATHTKIHYGSDGLVIEGFDAEIADITGLGMALDGKASLVHTHAQSDVVDLDVALASKAAVDHVHDVTGVSLDPDLIDIGALTPAEKDTLQYRSGHWTNRTPAQLKTDLVLTFPDIAGILGGGQIPSLDASKIGSGTFLTSLIPGLDAGKITSGIFGGAQIPSLPASQITSGVFGSSQIPGLDATKITSGFLDLLRIPTMDSGHIPSLDASKITTGLLDLLRIPGLPAGQITSGIFGTGQIPSLSASKITGGQFPQSMLNITDIAAGIISGTLNTGNIPNLDAGKITSGVLNLLRIPGLDVGHIPSLPASQVTSGTFGATLIPALDASKITTGTLLSALIPGLPASQITSGILDLAQIPGLDVGRIPSLPASQITSGIFGTGLIPSLDATKITTGVLDLLRIPGLDAARIPTLDASKIVSGILALAQIPGLDVGRIPSLPAAQITSGTFGDGLIPGLDASKIISGAFSLSNIPNLPASQITSGVLNLLRIPGLPAEQVTSGVFGGSLIPSLDASKIISGILDLAQIPGLDVDRIPSLPASQITSGTLAEALIPFLPASQITSGVFGGSLIPSLDASKITSGELLETLIPFLDPSKVSGLPTALAEMLTYRSPLNALNLFNQVHPDLTAQVSASSIGTATTNLITDPTFQDSDFNGGGVYDYDPAEGHAGAGSVRTVADGSGAKELLSNLIPVSEGQVMPISGWAKWTGLSGSGNVVQLNVTGYYANGATVQTTVVQRAASPPTTDWTQLSGTYTVPTNVTSLRVRLTVTPAAVAGTVWWDDLSVTKTQNVFQRLIAGTDPGTTLTTDVTNLFTGIVSNAQAILQRAGLTDFNNLVSTIGGSVGSDIAAAEARLNAFLHGDSPLNADRINSGTIADARIPGLSTINDALVTAVGNLTGSGFDIDKVVEVLSGQRYSVVDNSAVLSGMFSRLAHAEGKLAALPVSLGGTGVNISYGGAQGVTDTDEFERVSSTNLGALWSVSYSGGAGTWATPNGHDASFTTSGVANRDFLCIRNNPEILRSATDYQRVTNVLSAKGGRFYDALLGTYNYCGHNDVWLRISDDTTSIANVTGTRVRWGADGSLSIVRFLSGIPTTLKSYPANTITPPGPGAMLIGEAGDMNGGEAGKRYFRGIIGNSLRIEVTEVGVASGFGPQFRRWGHGGRAEGHVLPLPGQQPPGTLHHWNGMDQTFS